MGFFKKLFGSDESELQEYVDKNGIYFYVRCDNCGTLLTVRADKYNDLAREGSGFIWHKTIVDNKCFRRMRAVVVLDGRYNITHADLQGGQFMNQKAYEAVEQAEIEAKAAAEAGETAEDNL
ncbi:MAG: hypothetical protein GY796_18655 [Chloroflexi bacterium]|nr:hypothetical protein [Chloroflexota bacterium]